MLRDDCSTHRWAAFIGSLCRSWRLQESTRCPGRRPDACPYSRPSPCPWSYLRLWQNQWLNSGWRQLAAAAAAEWGNEREREAKQKEQNTQTKAGAEQAKWKWVAAIKRRLCWCCNSVVSRWQQQRRQNSRDQAEAETDSQRGREEKRGKEQALHAGCGSVFWVPSLSLCLALHCSPYSSAQRRQM